MICCISNFSLFPSGLLYLSRSCVSYNISFSSLQVCHEMFCRSCSRKNVEQNDLRSAPLVPFPSFDDQHLSFAQLTHPSCL
jgi:hypothetical protein